jgi:hypothetical protein
VIGAFSCAWHDALIDPDAAVLVGVIERGSGPPLSVYACRTCASDYDLLPLAEHPAHSAGLPLHRSGKPVVSRRQAEAPDRAALRAYIDHTGDCAECSRRLLNCERGQDLWDEFSHVRSAAPGGP